MEAVITGDIINSRNLEPGWLEKLKQALTKISIEGKRWELFRGDGFQIESSAADALLNAIYIKASIKSVKNADVRIGIGIGGEKQMGNTLAESSGAVFYNSGSALDSLKKNKVTMALKSDDQDFNEEMNIILKLAMISMDSWAPGSAELVKYSIEYHNPKQAKLSKLTGKKQSSVSEALKRAHYTEILELDKLYRKKINELEKSL